MDKIRIAICNQNGELCDEYKNVFAKEKDMEFAGVAYDYDSCLRLVRFKEADILLFEPVMENQEDGFLVMSQFAAIRPKMKILVLSACRTEENVFRAFLFGAENYFCEEQGVCAVLQGIRMAYEDKTALSAEVSGVLIRHIRDMAKTRGDALNIINKLLRLSDTEFDVLRMLYYGAKYKEIALKKFVEESTVRTLGSRIIKKFEMTSMKELLYYLRELKIFDYIDSETEK